MAPSIFDCSRTPLVRHVPMPALRWFASRRSPFDVVPVIVYQMAKVGSSAVVAALEKARLPVFHVHRMDAGHLHQMRESRRALGWHIPPVPSHDRLGLRLRRDVIDRDRRVGIITLVRDPIARNLSSYFEHLDAIWGRQNAHESVPVNSLVEAFHSRYTHDEPLTWFDDELLKVTGIDVYKYSFIETGYVTITHENVSLLVLKSELPDSTKQGIVAEFIGAPALSIEPTNRTGDKPKGAAFRDFLSKLKLDKSYLSRMLESRYTHHFYNCVERERMRQRYGG